MRNIKDEEGNKIDCFRCTDPLWKREMKRWVSVVVDKVRHQLASNNGPIIWMQVENEYDPDDEYLEWAVEMARNVTTEIPWSLCGHDIEQCKSGDKGNKVLCTVNGFWVDKSERGDQPSPTFFHKLWPSAQPAVWTEDQGWFDTWLLGQRRRSTSDQLYGIARFLAYGGAYHNFYMLTGGNNFERRAGRDATTAYAPDTVIDNLLLRHEPRFSSFRDFFHAIRSIQEHLLNQEVPVTPIPLKSLAGGDTTAEGHQYGSVVFLSNFGEACSDSGYFAFEGQSYYLPNHTVVILNSSSQAVVFNSSDAVGRNEEKFQHRTVSSKQSFPIANWVSFQERVGYGAVKSEYLLSPEQLALNNQSDYMWYTFYTEKVGNVKVKPIGWGGLQYVYVDGKLSNVIDGPTDGLSSVISRKLDGGSAAHHKVDVLSVAMGLSNQKKRIDVLSVAMGMSTTISPETGKGIESVSVGEHDASPQTRFSTAWTLRGEELKVYTDEGAKRVEWKPVPSNTNTIDQNDGLFWLQGNFEMPRSLLPFLGGAQPNQTAVVINLSGLNKGVAYVNGFNIGRYWLAPGVCEGDCAPPRHGPHCFLYWHNCGKPTQKLYHIPFEVLKASGNTVTVFEETAATNRNLSDVFLEIVHEHPT
jgi:Glycosyl hydrolases family 35